MISILWVALTGGLDSQTKPAQANGSCRPIGKQTNFVCVDHVKLKLGERYRRSPVVAFEVGEDGTINNLKIVRTSGVSRIDKAVLSDVSNWSFKPRQHCGVVDVTVDVTIDWR
jgi:TonB family protein